MINSNTECFITAAEANKLSLQAERPILMNEIYLATEKGRFSIVVDELSDENKKRLTQLGFEVSIVLSGTLIRWKDI